jgi:outer membrane lipoprotein SlyB
VINVREVVIEGSAETGVGQWGGAMIGGAAGVAATGGGGVESVVASSVTAVGGMIAGREIEKAVTKADGYEITVELEDGTQVLIVQEMDKGEFYDGDKVRVMVGNNTTEVMH